MEFTPSTLLKTDLNGQEVRTAEELSSETGKALFAHRGTGRVPSVAVFVLWT